MSAVRYLERFAQALSAIGKRLYFVSVKGQAAQMLDLLCLLRNIEIFPSIEVFNSASADKFRKHYTPPQPVDSDASRSFIMMVSLLSVLGRAKWRRSAKPHISPD